MTKITLDQHKMITRCKTRTPKVDLQPNMQHNENKLESLALKRALTLNLKAKGHWNTKHKIRKIATNSRKNLLLMKDIVKINPN